jgi:DNA invertase Pin-like site-specific DNA recombinase
MSKIGYARVSTSDQDASVQVERLKAAGCTIIRSETASGASREGRRELGIILQFIHPGEELVVVRLDRLGRSARDVLNIVHEIDGKGAVLRILEPEVVSTAGPSGRMMIQVLGMVADLELTFIQERQKAGIEAAKVRGVYRGRKKSVPEDEIRRLARQGVGKAAIARQLRIGRSSVYRALADDPPAAPLPSPPTEAETGHTKTAVVRLHLRVERNSKFVRGKKRVIEDIEDILERRYGMNWLDNGDYRLLVPYGAPGCTDETLGGAIAELHREMAFIADLRHCFIETDFHEPATDRSW